MRVRRQRIWLSLVFGVLVLAACGDERQDARSAGDLVIDWPNVMVRHTAENGYLACLPGGESDPIECREVFTLEEFDPDAVSWDGSGAGARTAWGVRLKGSVEDDVLTVDEQSQTDSPGERQAAPGSKSVCDGKEGANPQDLEDAVSRISESGLMEEIPVDSIDSEGSRLIISVPVADSVTVRRLCDSIEVPAEVTGLATIVDGG